MQNRQTATPASEALIDYIMHLTPAQCAKLVERLPMLERLVRMSSADAQFADTVISRTCDKVSA